MLRVPPTPTMDNIDIDVILKKLLEGNPSRLQTEARETSASFSAGQQNHEDGQAGGKLDKGALLQIRHDLHGAAHVARIGGADQNLR